MSRIARLHSQNLSLTAAKLGIASGLGVLMVAALVIGQMRANTMMRQLDAGKSPAQQTIARDAVDVKASCAACRSASAISVSPIIRRI